MIGRQTRNWILVGGATALFLAAAAQGCGAGGAAAFSSQGAGGTPSSSTSMSTAGGGNGGMSTFVGAATSSTGSGTIECGTPCLAATQVCSHGVCVPLTTCKTNNDCENDTYCDKGSCEPWSGAKPPDDPSCINVFPHGVFSPKIRCEFDAPPAGDAFPMHVDVQGTPIVVNFNKPASAGAPSIVASFTATVPMSYTEDLGVLRILSGKDCSLEANLAGVDLDNNGLIDWTTSPSPVAVGDLDGDGIAEIVVYGAENGVQGNTLAFTKKNGAWKLLWKAPPPAGMALGTWSGPSIHDIDDDGVPEIIREGAVFNANGSLKSLPPPNYVTYSAGQFPVLANLDQDPNIEFTNGQYVWEWKNGGWVQETYFPGANVSAPGYVAVADFGAYGTNVPASNPEIVVVRNNAVMIYAITGEFALAPVDVPGTGGGPPTVGDFDGDGLPEVAIAGQASYTMFDIDCTANPRPGGKCNLGHCDYLNGPCTAGSGIAWSRQSQDISSNITGSSVFDFNADGTSQAIYADECFTRVYDGSTGDVLFSQFRSSCTWNENPVVADVEGTFRSNLVVPANKACSVNGAGIPCQQLDANGVDATFPGLRCAKTTDCVSGVCDSGLCRCTSGAQCCAAMDTATCLAGGYACVPPPMGTPGTGNTCRAAHPTGVSGIRVYEDANDEWVRSRTIWNQHAYAVTNVNDDGTIPKTSDWAKNWLTPGLNNFREQVPGTPNGAATGDATAGPSQFNGCAGGAATLSAPICNRGADPIASGLSVGFYLGAKKLCGTTTAEVLDPAQCETVSCVWSGAPTSESKEVNVTVKANDNGQYKECNSGNDEGTISGVFCIPAQ